MLVIKSKKISILSITMIFLLITAMSPHAMSEDQSEVVRKIVDTSVQELLVKFNEEKVIYDTDPNRFLNNMDGALSKIVDFRRIAARVMGKYGRSATDNQKDEFVKVFKDSLYNTYTKTLIESGVYEINVNKAEINTRSDKRASVYLDVVSSNGTLFPVIYSMHKTNEQMWMMENVIVFGVNIGLAFRDKFELEYRKNKGDINQVIKSWSVDLELKGAAEQAKTALNGSQG
ncbi:MAG: phospholipid transport system substrate-binding protein [Oleiphilaceae bacterium]|jgi:phospholipid transport system substrate-binding protein